MTPKQNWLNLLILYSLLIFASKPAHAQITPDGSLGAEQSNLTPNVPIGTTSGDLIDGGAQRGSNLFHSFGEFNVNDGQRVYFANPADVQNILTRVTGGQVSNILGTLGVDGSANLFLLNPNGIIFGPNARLDLRGSFVGSTANAIGLGEQGFFSATNPNSPPLLTVNPTALLFTQLQAPAGITNQSIAAAGINPNGDDTTGLRTADGKSLLLVGGNVNLDGGRLRAYGGRIELAGLSAPGNVGLNVAGDILSLNVPNDVPRADVSLINKAAISVFGAGGGDIAINARDLEISNSFLFAGIGIGLGNAGTQAGDITLNATGAITVAQIGSVDNSVYTNASGSAGNINISGRSLSFVDGASLYTNTEGKGNAGNIFIQAQDSVALVYSDIFSNIEAGGVGKGGNINITAGSLSVTDGSQIQTILRGADTDNNLGAARGDAGNVNIDIRGAVSIAGVKDGFSSAINSNVQTGAEGNGGNINIKSGTFSLTDGANLDVSTGGKGNAGSVFIQASDSVLLGNNSSIYSFIFQGAEGNGGSININTGSLTVNKGGELNATVRGSGNGGNININARDRVAFDGKGKEISSRALTAILPGATGKAGNIQITTGTLSLTNRAFLNSSTNDRGDAGNITIDAHDAVTFDSGGYVSSNVYKNGVGKAGDIQITTGSLAVTNGASLNNSTDGRGNAGNITVNARDTITFEGGEPFLNEDGTQGSLPSSASSTLGDNGVGNGGDIRINARALFLKNGGQINASSFGQGNAGDITIHAQDTVAFDGVANDGFGSGAFTLGSKGNGGDILVTTGTLSLTNGGSLSTLARGNAGNITINARDITFDGIGSKALFSGAASLLLSGGATGKGGDIQITTNSLSVTNGALLVANTAGQGNGGNITINARDTVKFDGVGNNGRSSGAYSTVESTGVGNAGNVIVNARDRVSFSSGSQLGTDTSGQGNAGNITIRTGDLLIDGANPVDNQPSGIFSTVREKGVGRAGNIDIAADSLAVTNGGIISGVTYGQGRAGDITVKASDRISVSGTSPDRQFSAITTETGNTSTENAGNITLDTEQLSISDGAYILASTNGQGSSGSIFIDTVELELDNQAGISVASVGSGEGGQIQVQAETLSLNDRSLISAETATTNGGDITLSVDDSLLLRRGSFITTNAGTAQAGGNGGNITINAFNGALVAVPTEDSDIRANAYTGNGGNVRINAQGIFGIQERSQPTLESDITASSLLGVQGQIAINQPDVQPTQGLIELPEDILDASNQIAQTCPRGTAARRLGEFVVSGRGNLPPNPIEPLAGTTNMSPLATLESDSRDSLSSVQSVPLRSSTSSQPSTSTPLTSLPQIVEAQGWIETKDGKIKLVAQAPEVTPSAATTVAACPASR